MYIMYIFYIYDAYINIFFKCKELTHNFWDWEGQRSADSGKLVYISIPSQGLSARRTDGTSSSSSEVPQSWNQKELFHFESKRHKRLKSQLKVVRQEEFPLIHERVSIFVLFRLSIDWVTLPQIRKGNLLYSVYWFKC